MGDFSGNFFDNHNLGYNNLYKGYNHNNNMNLLEFLKKEENARKIFGKRELKIIEKQLHGLNLTQSEKNRLSRDIRKKLEFIKEISKYSSDFQLKHGAIIKELIQDSLDIVKKDFMFHKIKRIIIFGSTLEKTRHLSSDIDLAAEFDVMDVKEATKFRIRISGKLNDKIDLQVYNILPNKLKEEIDKKGRVLYKKDE